jgi:hypothetical protein
MCSLLKSCSLLTLALSVTLVLLYQNIDLIWPPPESHIEIEPYYRNLCYNHKDLRNSTESEKLKAFIKGPCTPVSFTPGYMGSRLRIEITSCKLFQETYPEHFASCHWNSCDHDFWPFYRKPNNEYDTWIPPLFGPFGILMPNSWTSKCYYN